MEQEVIQSSCKYSNVVDVKEGRKDVWPKDDEHSK